MTHALQIYQFVPRKATTLSFAGRGPTIKRSRAAHSSSASRFPVARRSTEIKARRLVAQIAKLGFQVELGRCQKPHDSYAPSRFLTSGSGFAAGSILIEKSRAAGGENLSPARFGYSELDVR
jgi:hypothetical protein